MKANTYSRFFLMLSFVPMFGGMTVVAQDVVSIPDPNFKSALLANTNINTNGDAEIQLTEASAYTGTVSVSNQGISDLTGIEKFVSITGLNCANNHLTELDVSANVLLTQLRCNHNQLNALDVSANTALISLECYVNPLTALSVANTEALTTLKCWNNQLTSLDLGEISSLTDLRANHNRLTSLDLGNSNLKTLYVYNNDLTELDVTGSLQLTDLRCNVNKLVSLDLTENTLLTNLNCSNNKLITLSLAAESALQTLSAQNNSLAVLDLSSHVALTSIDFKNNDLIYFNIQNGHNTQLIAFNTTGNPYLECIQVDDPAYSASEWTLVDAASEFNTSCTTENSEIVYIPDATFKSHLLKYHDIDLNDDKQIQVAEAGAFTGNIHVRHASVTDLTGIEAFPLATALEIHNNLLETLDLSANTALKYINAFDNKLTSLDLSANTLLERVYLGRNLLLTLDVSGLSALRILDVGENQLTTLDLSTNTQLTTLSVYRNQFSSLPLVENTQLIALSVEHNQVTSLDLSPNIALEVLGCLDNQLTSLDMSKNANLSQLDCRSNRLTYLNMANGNNWIWLRTTNNPDLFCIQVDDVAYAEASAGIDIDPWSVFHTFCSPEPIVFIPDTNFKNELLYQGYDTNGDGEIQVSEAEAEDTLFVADVNISDLTGIEAFVNLVRLLAFDNGVSSIDLSSLDQLYEVDLSNNTLEELTLPPNLKQLYAQQNDNLECIQVGDVAYAEANWRSNVDEGVAFSLACDGSLDFVYIPDANFKNALLANSSINTNGDSEIQYTEAESVTGTINVNSLGIEDMTGIEAFININDLRVHNNRITDLDVSANKELRQLHCKQNKLTSLDISYNKHLYKLRCFNNNLTSLNVQSGSYLNFHLFDVYHNNLTCIQVDDVAYAEANLQDDVDEGVIFSTDCTSGGARLANGTSAADTDGPVLISVFPNPFEDRITITMSNDDGHLQLPLVYDLAGRKITDVEMTIEYRQTVLNMSNQPPGYYIVMLNNRAYKVFKQ